MFFNKIRFIKMIRNQVDKISCIRLSYLLCQITANYGQSSDLRGQLLLKHANIFLLPQFNNQDFRIYSYFFRSRIYWKYNNKFR